jgi:hypothetical protein
LQDALIKALDVDGREQAFIEAGLTAALQGDFAFWRYLFEVLEGPLSRDREEDIDTSALISLAWERLRERNGRGEQP